MFQTGNETRKWTVILLLLLPSSRDPERELLGETDWEVLSPTFIQVTHSHTILPRVLKLA